MSVFGLFAPLQIAGGTDPTIWLFLIGAGAMTVIFATMPLFVALILANATAITVGARSDWLRVVMLAQTHVQTPLGRGI